MNGQKTFQPLDTRKLMSVWRPNEKFFGDLVVNQSKRKTFAFQIHHLSYCKPKNRIIAQESPLKSFTEKLPQFQKLLQNSRTASPLWDRYLCYTLRPKRNRRIILVRVTISILHVNYTVYQKKKKITKLKGKDLWDKHLSNNLLIFSCFW